MVASTVVVDERSDLAYGAFYLEGLRQLFGGHRIEFGFDGFTSEYEDDHPFAFRVLPDGDGPELRVFVSASDWPTLDAGALAWADVYGKVNVADESASDAVVPIGPSFPVRLSRKTIPALPRTRPSVRDVVGGARRAAGHLRRGRLATHGIGRDRLPIEAYRAGRSEPGYVFFTAWAWQKHAEVNEPRGRFVQAARAAQGVRFEGGFVPRSHDDVPNVRGLTGPGPFTLAEFLDRTARSVVAFQCPAVHGCMGWKCGEFLALGKAIISTGVPQRLPAPLRHGEEIWYVDDDVDALRGAIERIAGDDALRTHLEQGARAYYDRWLAPAVVVDRLLGRRT